MKYEEVWGGLLMDYICIPEPNSWQHGINSLSTKLKKKKKCESSFLKQKKTVWVLLIHFSLLQFVKYKHVFPVRYPWRTKYLRGLVITFLEPFTSTSLIQIQPTCSSDGKSLRFESCFVACVKWTGYFTPFLRGSWKHTWHFQKHQRWEYWAPHRVWPGPCGATTGAGFFEDDRGQGWQIKSHSRQISSVRWPLGAKRSLATWKISVGKHFLHVKYRAKLGWNGSSVWGHCIVLLLSMLHGCWV